MLADMPRHHSARRSLPTLLLCALAALALGGCALGKRPSLVESPTLDDAAANAVLDRFERAPGATFTATYTITPSLTGAATQATVRQAGERQRITIGAVDYFSNGTTSRTCVAGTDECVDGIDDARVSDLSITHAFWSESAAARLANDASRSIGPSTGRNDSIAGRSVTCVDLPMPGLGGEVRTVSYCVVDEGVLARYAGADVSIDLTSITPTADEAELSG
jgi:hypothetical protein